MLFRSIGKTIELFPTQTQFGKKMVDCIRVRRHRPAAQGASARPANDAADIDESLDDEIPY